MPALRKNLERLLIASLIAAWGVLSIPPRANAGIGDVAVLSRYTDTVRITSAGATRRPLLPDEILTEPFQVDSGEGAMGEISLPRDGRVWVGENTGAAIDPARAEVQLGNGTILLKFPKKHARRPLRLGDAALIGSGSIAIVDFEPEQYLKVIVVSGSVRIFLTSRFGHSRVLRPGEMIITHPRSGGIPEPAHVDLTRLAATSRLLRMAVGGTDAATAQGVLASARRQDKQKAAGRAFETNLWIDGRGTTVLIDQPPPGLVAGQVESEEPVGPDPPRSPKKKSAPLTAFVTGRTDASSSPDVGEDRFVFALDAFTLQ